MYKRSLIIDTLFVSEESDDINVIYVKFFDKTIKLIKDIESYLASSEQLSVL